ncbi:type II toxin-antitoxin system VapC family toxin [Skermania piniformis]|uniref:PIN domain-containing protein n=1 Tax=Skermania pinensis TaxID=39122 RepID=A0ABX8S988_9ACTN|nr:hypothetical protein [Skermania piniformis]QXQ14036.1 hypothetical protein KV203_00765 [Skermania piniformis]
MSAPVQEAVTGVVFDTAAVVGFTRMDPYPQAVCWTVFEHGGTIVIPSAVLAAASARVAERDRDVLAALLALPHTVVPTLDANTAPKIGAILRGRTHHHPDALIAAAHAVTHAMSRRWYVVTDRVPLLTRLDPRLLFDSLP